MKGKRRRERGERKDKIKKKKKEKLEKKRHSIAILRKEMKQKEIQRG